MKQDNRPHRREQIKEVEISDEEESRKNFSAKAESEEETEIPLILEEEISEEGADADAPTEIIIPSLPAADEPASAFKPFRPQTFPPPPKPVSAKAESIAPGGATPEEDLEWTGNFALPPGVYAHFLMIDIKAPVKQIRKTPRFFPVKNIRTLIGRAAKAHVRLDDPRTVEVKHAKLILEEKEGRRDFMLYPLNLSRVAVNGKFLPRSGLTLKNGDRIKIGSADLIFFVCDMRR